VKQNRRMFLGRFLGGLGVAALGAEAASALVKSPETGLKILPSRIHNKDVPGPQLPKGGYEHIQMPLEWWQKPVEWLGDPLDHNKPLSEWLCIQPSLNGQIMREFYQPHTDAEFADAFEFYMGLQWPEEAHEARMRENRPTLVINMVGRVLDRAIQVSKECGEPTDLTQADWREVIINIVRRNRDPQLHYNALTSSRLEMLMLQVKPQPIIAQYPTGSMWTFTEKGYHEYPGHFPPQAGVGTVAGEYAVNPPRRDSAPDHLL
jgi:hypothetical protein